MQNHALTPQTKELISKLCDPHKECVVYGFYQCYYITIAGMLEALGYKAETIGDYNDNEDMAKAIRDQAGLYGLNLIGLLQGTDLDNIRIAKALLLTTFIKNFEKAKNNKKITPIFFFINLEGLDQTENLELDVTRLISSHSEDEDSYTSLELYFCYKLYKKTNSEFKKIIEQTLKFITVRVLESYKDEGEYVITSAEFELVEPFWKSQTFVDSISQRQYTPPNPNLPPKRNPWRDVLIEKFGPEILECNKSFSDEHKGIFTLQQNASSLINRSTTFMSSQENSCHLSLFPKLQTSTTSSTPDTVDQTNGKYFYTKVPRRRIGYDKNRHKTGKLTLFSARPTPYETRSCNNTHKLRMEPSANDLPRFL